MTTITNTRAQKNGEYGVNGEFYHGGQFLPSSANTVKGEMGSKSKKANKPFKQEIAPYVWAYAPEGKTSIFTKIAGIFGRIENGVFVIKTNEQTLNYFKKTMAEVEELADKYNNGERWI